ncbi:MAG: hypothetical protein IIA85_02210 [Nanoarchaeota archaeon]|nr:hypothetical protein [Nanoarchaeota archaeon]
MRDKKEVRQEINFFNNILKDVKGLSNVIVTLIMIVLVLVAVGLIWTAVQSNIESGTEQIEVSAKCLKIDIKATKLECGGVNNGVCNVTVTRNVGGDDLAGIKLILTNTEGETNYVNDVPGNIVPLETKTEVDITTGLTDVSIVAVAPYFLDPSGLEQLCSSRGSFGS